MIVKSVQKALQVLKTIAYERDGLTAQEISERLSLPYPTAYRLLHTLTHEGYLAFQESHKTYRVGPEFLQLYSPVSQQANLGRLIYPILAQLSHEIQETVHLAVRQSREVMYLDTIPSSQSLAMYTPTGTRAPLHSTALGKALLAFLPDDEIETLLAKYDFVPRTEFTITTKEDMWRSIAETRARGFAVDWDEGSIGLRCVASVILNQAGYPEAAISASIPGSRLREKAEVGDFAAKVTRACHSGSALLGARLSPNPENWYKDVTPGRRVF